ncbi:hypothetical protein TW85_17160 [Marinomonas sp. S3726]|nr:hypothetical protein TW85_17160 [Marinomonas sp. S3726]
MEMLASNLFWPRFDKTWPLKRSQEPSKKIAFAATNFSLEHFHKAYQGKDTFSYFDFPLNHLWQKMTQTRQAEYLAGRLCAHQLLFDFAVHHEYLESDDKNVPIWPKGIIGSIAHCYPYALVMIAKSKDYQSIGVSIVARAESRAEFALSSNTAFGVLTQAERLRFATHLDELTLALIYSVKKSVIKALSPLILSYLYFDDMSVIAIDWLQGSAELSLERDLGGQWVRGQSFSVQFDFYHSKVISMLALPRQLGFELMFP